MKEKVKKAKEKISKHNIKDFLCSLGKKIKPVVLMVLKILARIPYLCVAGIPFLNRFIPSDVVLWVWIPALVISLLIDLLLHKKHSKNPPEKKQWEKNLDDFTKGSSIVAFVVFLSAIIINYFDTAYNWWIAIAIILFFAIPFSINGMFDLAKRIKQEKQSSTVDFTKAKIQYVLFYWLADAFYISVCTNWDIGKFVFGGIALLILLYSVASSFLSQKIKYKWMLIHDFVITIALTVYLIYIIPDASMQNVVLVLVSAIYGGFIALVGVAWTIKDGQQREAESKRLEKIPYLQVEIDKWITSERGELNVPGIWLNITPSNNENSISSGASIKITNIGLGMANNLQCRSDSATGSFKHSLPTALLRCDASCSENMLFNAARQDNTSVNDSRLIFLFDDLLGNHYEQSLQITFEINVGYIKVISYKMDAPVFLGRDNYSQSDSRSMAKEVK
ncbi:MAG: hypothetical protein IJ492_01725 [Clostridia bacterium]|nr:hypothetical protein [Clostridia bacterium]